MDVTTAYLEVHPIDGHESLELFGQPTGFKNEIH
jgi:hypothetical protein